MKNSVEYVLELELKKKKTKVDKINRRKMSQSLVGKICLLI